MGGRGVGKRRGRRGEVEGVDTESLDTGDGKHQIIFFAVAFRDSEGDGCCCWVAKLLT